MGRRRAAESAEDEVRERFVRVTGLPVTRDDDAPEARPPTGRAGVLAAFDPGRRGVRALAVVAVLVVCVAAFLAWQARPRPTPVASAEPGTSAPPALAPATPTAVLIVSVGGRVKKPGLVRLPAGARVADAIEAAGGVLPDTDLTGVNLARKVVDGEMILIGVTPPPGAAGANGNAGSSGSGATGGVVNLNTASLAELQTLPGIGAVLAQRILDYRTEHGGFKSVNELRQVDGIGDAKFAQLKDRVMV
jgi:competence protein ComEA